MGIFIPRRCSQGLGLLRTLKAGYHKDRCRIICDLKYVYFEWKPLYYSNTWNISLWLCLCDFPHFMIETNWRKHLRVSIIVITHATAAQNLLITITPILTRQWHQHPTSGTVIIKYSYGVLIFQSYYLLQHMVTKLISLTRSFSELEQMENKDPSSCVFQSFNLE